MDNVHKTGYILDDTYNIVVAYYCLGFGGKTVVEATAEECRKKSNNTPTLGFAIWNKKTGCCAWHKDFDSAFADYVEHFMEKGIVLVGGIKKWMSQMGSVRCLDDRYVISSAYIDTYERNKLWHIYPTAQDCKANTGVKNPVEGFIIIDKNSGKCAEGVPLWYENFDKAFASYLDNLAEYSADSIVEKWGYSDSIAMAYKIPCDGKDRCIPVGNEKCLNFSSIKYPSIVFVVVEDSTKHVKFPQKGFYPTYDTQEAARASFYASCGIW